MLRLALTAASAALSIAGAAQAADVTGLWRTPEQGGVIEIAACGDSVCGKVVASKPLETNPDLRDARNKNPALRSRPLKGLIVLQGFHHTGEAWTGGQIYDPVSGGTFKGELQLSAPDRLQVTAVQDPGLVAD
jgi:uncharacterized protein (DUF2147 family)